MKSLYRGQKKFLGGVKNEGMSRKKVIKKILQNEAKKGELRAEKQQVYHMACHGSVSCIYPNGAWVLKISQGSGRI